MCVCACVRACVRACVCVWQMRGLLPNLIKAAPAAAINFALYDWVKGYFALVPQQSPR